MTLILPTKNTITAAFCTENKTFYNFSLSAFAINEAEIDELTMLFNGHLFLVLVYLLVMNLRYMTLCSILLLN